MPRATADLSAGEKVDLKSLSEGWVQLRKLSYGEMLERQDMAGKMAMSADAMAGGKNPEATIQMAQSIVTAYEFARCIVEHNLEDEGGNKLNFQNAVHVNSLDPQVGEEISELIDKLNHLPEDLTSGK